MTAKEKFLELYGKIARPGAKELLEWIEGTDFFTAPASTRFHGNYEGGLVEHSVNVAQHLLDKRNLPRPDGTPLCTEETAVLCGLLHDLCKANYYTVQMRNAKNETTGQWEKVPYYTVKDQFPYGHGEKSVFLISRFLRLSDEEAMAIRWHMGAFDETVKGGSYALANAMEMYPLILYMQMADQEASLFDEAKKD